MNIEKIYKDALASGNHSSALHAVFEAGKGFGTIVAPQADVTPVFVEAPTGEEYIIKRRPFWPSVDVEVKKGDDSAK